MDLVRIIIWIIFILVILVVVTYFILSHIAKKFYTPPYPPNIRGSIDITPDFDELIKDITPWSKKLKVKVWDPINTDEYMGKTILFSHGWDSSACFFNPQIKHFRKKNWRVVAMDLRSMGESEYVNFATPFNFADDIAFVVRWIHEKYPTAIHLTVYAHSISGVALIIGQGAEIIDKSLVNRFVIEGIYTDGRYITDRFFRQFHIPKLLHKAFLIILFRKSNTCFSKDHPHFNALVTLSNHHPIRQLSKLANCNKPLIIIQAINDQVVPYVEFETYSAVDLPNIILLSFADGGHFKVAYQKDYFDRLETAFNQTNYS